MADDTQANPIDQAVKALSDSLNADVFYINSPISDRVSSKLAEEIEKVSSKRDNVFLILVTLGGDPHSAYMIGRNLQRCYKKVTIYIGGDCYSAGTLILLCAHELVIGSRGKLGPLDVQLLKRDEIRERLSGLTVSIALEELRTQVFTSFISFVDDLKGVYGPQITLKTAMEVAGNVTSGLYGEVYKQVDPIKLGDDARSLDIAKHYGERLGRVSDNLKDGAVDRLLNDYPSHECVIDRKEAEELFKNIRDPNEIESVLMLALGKVAIEALPNLDWVIMLSEGKTEGNTDDSGNESKANDKTKRDNKADTPSA